MPTLVKHESHGSTCPPCSTDGPFLRNHYFTGKLLVERDFTEEQGYHLGKLRHHNHRLHGYGVVCGLRVHAHPDPACRDRYVCIEPGSAIDCCGREIVLRDHDVFGRTLAADEPSCAALVDLESFAEVLALYERRSP